MSQTVFICALGGLVSYAICKSTGCCFDLKSNPLSAWSKLKRCPNGYFYVMVGVTIGAGIGLAFDLCDSSTEASRAALSESQRSKDLKDNSLRESLTDSPTDSQKDGPTGSVRDLAE